MKKIFAFALSLALIGCDDNPVRTETVVVEKPKTTVQTNITKKTVILAKGAVYDTIRTKFENNSIVGSVISNGTTSVVCSEQMNRCAIPNSKGVYQINLPIHPLMAGRIYEGIDTVSTPENVDLSPGDTTVIPSGKDTNVVSDTLIDSTVTVSGNDTLIVVSIEVIDSIKSADSIKVEISEPNPVAIKDTLSVVSGGTILREIPINSWGHILDSGFVDKWSIEVYDTTFDRAVKNIEFVYFATGDSIAQVVTLGRAIVGGEFTNRFSGPFFYYWDDSAYSKDKFIHNYFIRGKDSLGNVIAKTEIETFSAKAIPAKIVYLGKKIGLPQYLIKPKFVPAAKNNKKLKESVLEFLVDTTQNWVGMDNLPFSWDYLNGEEVGAIGFERGKKINFDSMGIVLCSFEIETDADSLKFGTGFITNTSTKYILPIDGKMEMYIGAWKDGYFTTAKITNIRFYFKQN